MDKKEYLKKYYKSNKDSKKYYCSSCDKSCESNSHLQRHLKSLKHNENLQRVKNDIIKNVDYDKLWLDFLASNHTTEYKNIIISLIETDYTKFTNPKINKDVALKLNEIEFREFKKTKLIELTMDLGLPYKGLSKKALIEQIELIKKVI